MTKSIIMRFGLMLVIALCAVVTGYAQNFPTRPEKKVVPVIAGGNTPYGCKLGN